MSTRKIIISLGLLGAVLSNTAFAYDWAVTANVTQIEATYLPWTVMFSIDVQAGNCPPGAYIQWNGTPGSTDQDRKDNVKGVYAMLISSLVSGGKIILYGNNVNCQGAFIRMLQ